MGLGLFVFAWIRSGTPRCRRVHSVSVSLTREGKRCRVGLFLRAYKSSGSHGVAWVQSSAPRGRRVHWGMRGLTRVRLVVVGFIRVRVGALGRASGSFGFAQVQPCH